MRVGFIGTGIMGKPMAHNLLRAGFAVSVHNRSRSRLADLISEGAAWMDSPRAVAAASELIVTMLPGWAEFEAVLVGSDGLLAGIRPGAIHLSMETVSPGQARRAAAMLQELGASGLDAPVSGGERGAIDASLAIMVGGAQEAFDVALPVLQAMGRNVIRIGPSGAGQIAKACNQLIVAVTIEAVAEALALARAAGVDPANVRRALAGGFADSRILQDHGRRMLDGDYLPGGHAKHHLKDRAVVEEIVAATGIDLPVAEAAFARIATLVERGRGELDHSALFTLFSDDAAREL